MLEIRWHGRAGQGVVTAGQVLAELALEAGLFFQTFPDYGPERSGAPVRAYTRLDAFPIRLHSQIQEPDVVVVLDPTLLESEPITQGLKENGVLIVNTSRSPTEIRKLLGWEHGRMLTLDASRISQEALGKEMPNAPLLGTAVAATGILPQEELLTVARRTLEKKFPPPVVEGNLEAMRRGGKEFMEG